MVLRPGDEWGTPWTGAPDVEVHGDDAALLRAVNANPGAVVRFIPTASSQVARCVGLSAASPASLPAGIALPMDLLELDDGRRALNMAILATPPPRVRATTRKVDLGAPHGRALSAVVAIGQFHDGVDLVPRGHPGDGRAELHIYRLARRDRTLMRARLRTGEHVPHPDISTTSVRNVEFRPPRPVPLLLDGISAGAVGSITLRVVTNAYRLLV